MNKLKEEIRKEILNKLKKQKKEERRHKSEIIKKKLFSSMRFKKARVTMFYVSRDEEVNTRGMIDDALKVGKRVVVPYSVSETKEIIASELIDARKDLELGP
ncbi:MAG: 5-formyltetrahydrofolate cyclo-ligase, partial [Candidatus Omnitrophica bacterium]|nr:5-formyltetrahydrofolate cyclo-ligase [Candidatus Omnitrophota bacterium]